MSKFNLQHILRQSESKNNPNSVFITFVLFCLNWNESLKFFPGGWVEARPNTGLGLSFANEKLKPLSINFNFLQKTSIWFLVCWRQRSIRWSSSLSCREKSFKRKRTQQNALHEPVGYLGENGEKASKRKLSFFSSKYLVDKP